MPIYEYRCSTCGFQKEFLRKVADPVMTVCPECGKQTFSKMLTAAGFQLKGSGWYATDFKNSGAKPAAKAESKGKSDTAAKDAAKIESKDKGDASAKDTAKSESKDKGDTVVKDAAKTESKSEAPGRGTGAYPACS
jgi:putative FmdB family regulatory protein